MHTEAYANFEDYLGCPINISLDSLDIDGLLSIDKKKFKQKIILDNLKIDTSLLDNNSEAKAMKKLFDITENITLWDERLSSQGAFNLSNELAINSSKKVKKKCSKKHKNALKMHQHAQNFTQMNKICTKCHSNALKHAKIHSNPLNYTKIHYNDRI